MNSLKKVEGVPLLNFKGGPRFPLLNFRGDPGPRSQHPEVPGPRVLLYCYTVYTMSAFCITRKRNKAPWKFKTSSIETLQAYAKKVLVAKIFLFYITFCLDIDNAFWVVQLYLLQWRIRNPFKHLRWNC